MRGADPGRLMAQLMAKENGLSRGKDSGLHGGDLENGIFGSTSMLGSSLPVAVGAALKFKMKKDKNIAVAFFGEGAASRGDVHEAMNFAGVHKLPVLFVCENNRFAYSTPLEKQMAIENVADRARAYGFPGHVVSGNDLLAVVAVADRLVDGCARAAVPSWSNARPIAIAVTASTTRRSIATRTNSSSGKRATRFRNTNFSSRKKGHDLKRIRDEVDERTRQVVQAAVEFAEHDTAPDPKEAMEDLYAPPLTAPTATNGRK